ncbi:MAG: TlpA disulfide reductase family protein [Gemmataceae bacterium]
MSTSKNDASGWIAARNGFLEGVAGCLILYVIGGVLRRGVDLARDWPLVLALAIPGGVIFAMGRGLAGSLGGALTGGIAGVFLGSWLGTLVPAWTITLPGKQTTGEVLELEGPGLDGQTLRVSDYRGKVLLVDFWATWCLPCVQELPNVLDAYEKHHAAGFDVLAISLDDGRDQVEQFVEENKLPWKQILFTGPEERGWNNPLVRKLGIQGIPETFLLNREGRVVAQGLRGTELERRVAQLLENEAGDNIPAAGGQTANGARYLSMLACSLGLALMGALVQRRMWLRTS